MTKETYYYFKKGYEVSAIISIREYYYEFKTYYEISVEDKNSKVKKMSVAFDTGNKESDYENAKDNFNALFNFLVNYVSYETIKKQTLIHEDIELDKIENEYK